MPQEEKNIITKPPVVVVVGHIDHGKSSLLEAIREDFKITQKESGGITQHIGAYEAEFQGKKITFIDTPGHEAFSAMRARGAKVADIAVLVVDAAEGVKDQTKEAISFIKKADIPLVVALNKIDKKEAQPERVKQEFAKQGVLVESYGGKVPSCNVSAKTKVGIQELLETILLVAELEDLKADISVPGQGTIIESYLDSKKGPVATLILEKGILKEDDVFGTPSTIGKVKNLKDFRGKTIKNALPAQPVIVLGFEMPPGVGENFEVFKTQEEAKENIVKTEKKWTPAVIQEKEGQNALNIILKADVLGSTEAIEHVLRNIPQEKVLLRILKSEVGNIEVSDIKLAESTDSLIFGFRVNIDETTKLFAQQKKVRWKIFDVIYDIVQEVRKGMVEVMEPEVKRINLGKIKISVLFKKSKNSQIVGGKVIEGEIERNSLAEVQRNDEIIGKGKIKSLQQEKKDIPSAGKGKECGMLFQGETELKEGDILVFFREEKKKGLLF